jgi:hypothetical protein
MFFKNITFTVLVSNISVNVMVEFPQLPQKTRGSAVGTAIGYGLDD